VNVAVNFIIFFFAYDQHQLGVGLQAIDTVNHKASGTLQALSFTHVILFVKACLYFK
jgi:hypothetical protein